MTFLIVLDGAEEKDLFPPVSMQSMPCLSEMMQAGIGGSALFAIPNRPVDSLACIAGVLDMPPGVLPESRAPVEALACGFTTETGALVYRCNVVSVREGMLEDACADALTDTEKQAFMRDCAAFLPSSMRLEWLSGYRGLLFCKRGSPLDVVEIPPPHQHIGQPVEKLLRNVPPGSALRKWIADSRERRPGVMLYPWCPGRMRQMPEPEERFRKTACVCKAEVAFGLAKLLGMHVCTPAGATGNEDTDLCAKAAAALALSARFDRVVLHINGADELAHRRDTTGKQRFLERVDGECLRRLVAGLKTDARFLLTSDHVTDSRTGRHEREPVHWFCVDYQYQDHRFVSPPCAPGPRDRRKFEHLLWERRKI